MLWARRAFQCLKSRSTKVLGEDVTLRLSQVLCKVGVKLTTDYSGIGAAEEALRHVLVAVLEQANTEDTHDQAACLHETLTTDQAAGSHEPSQTDQAAWAHETLKTDHGEAAYCHESQDETLKTDHGEAAYSHESHDAPCEPHVQEPPSYSDEQFETKCDDHACDQSQEAGQDSEESDVNLDGLQDASQAMQCDNLRRESVTYGATSSQECQSSQTSPEWHDKFEPAVSVVCARAGDIDRTCQNILMQHLPCCVFGDIVGRCPAKLHAQAEKCRQKFLKQVDKKVASGTSKSSAVTQCGSQFLQEVTSAAAVLFAVYSVILASSCKHVTGEPPRTEPTHPLHREFHLHVAKESK